MLPGLPWASPPFPADAPGGVPSSEATPAAGTAVRQSLSRFKRDRDACVPARPASAAHSLSAGTPCAPPAPAARHLGPRRHNDVLQENDLGVAPGTADSTLQAHATVAAGTACRVAGRAHSSKSTGATGTAGSMD